MPHFQHVVVAVFENRERGDITGSAEARTFAVLARRCASLDAYSVVFVVLDEDATRAPPIPRVGR